MRNVWAVKQRHFYKAMFSENTCAGFSCGGAGFLQKSMSFLVQHILNMPQYTESYDATLVVTKCLSSDFVMPRPFK